VVAAKHWITLGGVSMTPKSDARLGLFVSHSHNNRELALKIRDKLQILGNNSIDIHVSEEISGGVEWREWISAGLRQSKILVFLYTDESLNWAWPFYELGVFVGVGLGKHVCLLNTDISAPPGPLSEWQVYKADEPGVRKFLTELLAEGLLTDGVVINADLSREHYRAELDQAVNEICTLFARARVKQVYHENRISIVSQPKPGNELCPFTAR